MQTGDERLGLDRGDLAAHPSICTQRAPTSLGTNSRGAWALRWVGAGRGQEEMAEGCSVLRGSHSVPPRFPRISDL